MENTNNKINAYTFSKPFKTFVVILTIVLISIFVICLYMVKGPWEYVLVGSIFSIIILGSGIKYAAKAARSILTEKEKEDANLLAKSRFINVICKTLIISGNVLSVASIITVYMNLIRWMMFNILLLGTIMIVMVRGFAYVGIIPMLFFVVLWFPSFDKPLLKKWTYVKLTMIKLLITAVATVLAGIYGI